MPRYYEHPACSSESRTNPVIHWLLDGDPSIRWQILRDLLDADESAVERERRKISRDGWGARLLAKQNAAGTWARGRSSDGLYSPKWISTTYTMLLLRDLGLPPNVRAVQRACKPLLDGGLQPDGGVSYGTWAKWTRRGETCVTGMVLSILSYFDYEDSRLKILANHLLEQQMPDGGWNCRRYQGATHSSMHTTISALEGLLLYELHCQSKVRELRAAQSRAREFLLLHRLFRSHRTGKVIKPEFTRFSFPPRWHYDILRALDYFQDGQRSSRSAARRGHRNHPPQSAQRRPLASATLLQRKNLFRAGATRRAQPLEHSPRLACTPLVAQAPRRPTCVTLVAQTFRPAGLFPPVVWPLYRRTTLPLLLCPTHNRSPVQPATGGLP